jgi:8-oxo-dGTP pyrophosphatase MutT (NUDIX family)
VSEPQPASTVIIGRDTPGGLEVFMLRRSARSPFVPDVYVFPGGRVDSVDHSPAARMRILGETKPLDPAFVYAAAREAFEECGLLISTPAPDPAAVIEARKALSEGNRSFEQTLDALKTRVDGAAFRYFSRWITPAIEKRRFDARFFVARAPEGQIAEADAVETHEGRWIAPQTALDEYAAGGFAMVFPTIKHLERLTIFSNVDDLLAFAAIKTVVPVTPDVFEGPTFALPQELEGAW